jgi:hypothetical protein
MKTRLLSQEAHGHRQPIADHSIELFDGKEDAE